MQGAVTALPTLGYKPNCNISLFLRLFYLAYKFGAPHIFSIGQNCPIVNSDLRYWFSSTGRLVLPQHAGLV